MTYKVKGQGHKVTWSVWPVRPITREWIVVEISKLVGSFSTTRAMFRTSFKVKKVKAQGHRSIYSHTQNTSYLPNGKAYELQTSYAGRGQSPASLATTMTSKIKGQGHMVCLTRPAHNSRTNSRRIIIIGSKVAHDTSNIAAMLLHPGGGIPWWPNPAATPLVIIGLALKKRNIINSLIYL